MNPSVLHPRVDVVWAVPIRRPALERLLSPTELSRIAGMHSESDRTRFVAARVLVRLAVAEVLRTDPVQVRLDATCPACGAQHGKPVVIGPADRPAVHVSLAHAGERVLVAVTSAGPVGVDVEACSATGFDGFDDIALTPGEGAAVRRLPGSRQRGARTSIWTRKEAILKMRGVGLAESPADLEVGLGAGWHTGAPMPRPRHGAHLTDLEVGAGYRACVAVRAEHAGRVALIDGRAWLAAQAAGTRRAIP